MPDHRRSFDILASRSSVRLRAARVLNFTRQHEYRNRAIAEGSKNKVEKSVGTSTANTVTPHNPVMVKAMLSQLGRDATTARAVCQLFLNCGRKITVDKRELTAILQNPETATNRLLMLWRDVPLLLMLDVDWDRGPLVLIGRADGMMWPLLPPGSLLQLDQRVRTITDGAFSEAERPVYLIEYRNRFFCCHAQRRGDTLRLISHRESGWPTAISVPFKEARLRGQVTPIFRPLATKDNAPKRYAAAYR